MRLDTEREKHRLGASSLGLIDGSFLLRLRDAGWAGVGSEAFMREPSVVVASQVKMAATFVVRDRKDRYSMIGVDPAVLHPPWQKIRSMRSQRVVGSASRPRRIGRMAEPRASQSWPMQRPGGAPLRPDETIGRSLSKPVVGETQHLEVIHSQHFVRCCVVVGPLFDGPI